MYDKSRKGEIGWPSDERSIIRLCYEFVCVQMIMDLFTRSARGWHLRRGLDQLLTLIALDGAYVEHTPEIHHSDQGNQHAGTTYVRMLLAVYAET